MIGHLPDHHAFVFAIGPCESEPSEGGHSSTHNSSNHTISCLGLICNHGSASINCRKNQQQSHLKLSWPSAIMAAWYLIAAAQWSSCSLSTLSASYLVEHSSVHRVIMQAVCSMYNDFKDRFIKDSSSAIILQNVCTVNFARHTSSLLILWQATVIQICGKDSISFIIVCSICKLRTADAVAQS